MEHESAANFESQSMDYLIPNENVDNMPYSPASTFHESNQGDFLSEPFEDTRFDDLNMVPSSVAEKMKKLYSDFHKVENNVDNEFKQLLTQKTKMDNHLHQLTRKLQESEDLRQRQHENLISAQMTSETLTGKLQREEEQRSDIIKHVAELKVNFQALDEHYVAVSNKCNQLEQHIAFVTVNISTANAENTQLTEKNTGLKDQINSLKCAAELLKKEKDEMRSNSEKQITHFQEILEHRDEIIKKTEKVLETTQKEHNIIAESNKTFQNLNNEYYCKIKDLENQLESVKKSLELKTKDIKSLSSELQATKEDLLTYAERNDREHSQFMTLKEEKLAVQRQLEEIKQQSAKEIENWQKTVNDMLAEKENNNKDTKNFIKMLENTKAELNNEIVKQSKKIEKLTKELENSNEEVAKKENWVKSMAKELDNYKIECERKVKETQEISSSKLQELEMVNKNLMNEIKSTETKCQNSLAEKESALSALQISLKEQNETIVNTNNKLQEKTEAFEKSLLIISSKQSELDTQLKLTEELKKKIVDMKLFPTPSPMFNYPRIRPTATPVTSNTSSEERNIKGINDNVLKMRLLKAQGLYESPSNDSMSDSSLECTPVLQKSYPSQTRMSHFSESVSRLRSIPKRKLKAITGPESAPAKLDIEPSPGQSKIPKLKNMWYDGPKGD